MPLFPGKKNIGKNIKTEMKHGKPQKQAIVIAMSVAKIKKSPMKPMMKMEAEDKRDMKKGIKESKKEDKKEGKEYKISPKKK